MELARNTLWNLAGQIAPLVVGLVAIPFLIAQLGTERFGILSLVWIAIGYLSLFDLGLGRALTQIVAARRARQDAQEAATLAWTGLALMSLLAILAGAGVILATPWLVRQALNVPESLIEESTAAFYLVSLALPAVMAGAGLRGILEGWERFDLANSIRILISSLTYLAPLVASLVRPDLAAVVGSLVAVRFAGTIAYLWLCLRRLPGFGTPAWEFSRARELLGLGGWMSVSNLVSPILVHSDRFVIGTLLTMTAVAYYATPYEVVTKLLILPAAVSGVLFPAFSRTYVINPEATGRLFLRAVHASFLLLFPPVLVVLLLGPEMLGAWVGTEFAQSSSGVARTLALGVLVNGLAHIPFVLVQGAGRADITGKLHLVELPFYLAALWWLTGKYGVLGAALAWTGRVSVDAALLFAATAWLLNLRRKIAEEIAKLLALTALLGGGALLISGLWQKGLFLACALSLFLASFWLYVVDEETRLLVKNLRLRPASRTPIS